MASDLRDRNFTPYKPSPAAKSAQSAQADGCLAAVLTVIGIVLVAVGFMALIGGGGTPGAWFTLIGVFVLIRGLTMVKAARKGAKKAVNREAYREPIRQMKQDISRQVRETVREQVRQAEKCPNPEPHRHYEAAPKKQTYDTFVARDKRWPTPAERRLENMKNLYDAGLLTREEYNDEVRKIRG